MELEKKKTPLAETSLMLAQLCQRIDEGEALDEVMLQAFSETRLEHAAAVDRRLIFDALIKGEIETAKRERDEWASRAKTLETMHARFKENTLEILEANPDLPYVSERGKITVQSNPPSVDLVFDGDSLTPDMVSAFSIPDELVKVTYAVRKAEVLKFLKLGHQLPWARLIQGRSVRFRK